MTQKCGYIAIVGRPNVGKSTLLNCLIGKKISIVSSKPQTTRQQILGIKTIGSAQLIYIDTPGMHKVAKRAMNRYMNRLANAGILDADITIFTIEATHWREEDMLVLEKLKQTQGPVILAINKVDLIKDKTSLLPFISRLRSLFNFMDIVPLSAKKNDNVEVLEKIIIQYLPSGLPLFPEEQVTDKDERFQVAELIREKLIKETLQELPYTTTIILESFKTTSKIVNIHATIWVERSSQKPIVIGKQGERLKKIGTLARMEIEKLLRKKVFLRLWVKVKSDWTDDKKALGSLGYE